MRNRQTFGPLALWIFLTVAAVAATLYFSSQTAAQSSSVSMDLTQHVLTVVQPSYTESTRDIFHHIIRKLAHFVLYFILGCGLSGLSLRQTRFPKTLTVVALGAIYAASDEFHQSFVQGRKPGIGDVFLDICGVAAGHALILLLSHLFQKLPES